MRTEGRQFARGGKLHRVEVNEHQTSAQGRYICERFEELGGFWHELGTVDTFAEAVDLAEYLAEGATA